jgi:flagellar basal body-associated protein FliL
MSKLNALKEKLAPLLAKISEKADKIAFLRKWREKRKAAGAAVDGAGSPKDPTSLGSIYREGSTLTRVQVILFFVFLAISIVSAGSLVKKVLLKMKTSSEHEKLKSEYSQELVKVQQKHQEKAEMISLGQFLAKAWVGPQKGDAKLSVDLWIRVSDPKAAAVVNGKTAMFHDKATDALDLLYREKVNLLTDDGKAKARAKLKEMIGQSLPEGTLVEEVFIQNLVVQ